jgi:hypothetical protein
MFNPTFPYSISMFINSVRFNFFRSEAAPEFIKALGIAHEGAEAREKLS